MIDPAAIPQITGDMAALTAHATTVTGVGTAFADTGSRVHSTWQELAAVYDAPEAAQLFAATGPVKSVSESVGQDITAVGGALSAYATEVTPIKARLETLRAQAATFVETVAADDDWRENEGDVDRHNQLISDVNAAVADFMDAQRRCANTILALYTDRRYTAENGDGTVTADEFGYTREMLDAAMGEDGALPWGTAEEHDRGFLGDVGAFFGGIGEGFVGMVTGLGALIGYSEDTWSWGTAGAAWAGLGTFALAIGVYITPGGMTLDQTFGVPGFQRSRLGDTLTTAGKTLIAYDTWGEDNARAAGLTTFNFVAAVIGTKGGGGALRSGGAAAQGSRFATVANVGAGMVRAGEFLGRLPTVTDMINGVARHIPGLPIPHIDLPDIDIPTTSVDTPRIDSPTPVNSPDGPSVGDAVGHTPDTPRIDVPDADMPAGSHSDTHASSDQPSASRLEVDTPPVREHDTAASTGDGSPVDTTHDAAVDRSPESATGDAPPPDTTPDTAADNASPLDPSPDSAGLGTPPARSDLGTQPDGSWVGSEHGARLELDPQVNAAADDLLRQAADAERKISPEIRGVVGGVDGGRLQGYEYVLKSKDSLKRKLATEFETLPDLGASDAPGLVRDSVRYTMEIPPGSYVDGIVRAVDDLRARGFENVAFKPTWDNPGGYKGVNTNWLDPRTGQVFELQFHTPDSFAAKMDTHGAYEAMRVPGISAAEVARLADEQAAIFGRVDMPVGAERLDGIRDALEQSRSAPDARQPAPVGAAVDAADDGARRPGPPEPGGGGDLSPDLPEPGRTGGSDSPGAADTGPDTADLSPSTDGPGHQTPDGHPLPPPEPGMRSLGALPEEHVGRGPDGLVESVDGRPVDEYLREVGEQRAERFRQGRADGDFSRKEIGDVTSVVIDRRTGEIFEAANGRSEAVIPPDRVHPLLAQRLTEMDSGPGYPATNRDGSVDSGTRRYPHPDKPLGHAEVIAVNELLWRRGPDVDASVFEELRVDNFAPFRGDGVRAAPCCANCAVLLRGSPSNAGRFTGFPPGPHNFLPE